MRLSRTEVNLRRLLAKCELMIKSNQKNDERLPKYVSSLEDMFQEIKKLVDPHSNVIWAYHNRIQKIKVELQITSKYDEKSSESIRDELFGVRQRNLETGNAPIQNDAADLNQVINYHENMQQKITDDMLSLTRNLKEQSELANKIIKKDTEVVGKSVHLTEKNYTNLNTESNKLAEHSKRACRCWMWIMLLVVMVVFINMVLFMKVIKKKSY